MLSLITDAKYHRGPRPNVEVQPHTTRASRGARAQQCQRQMARFARETTSIDTAYITRLTGQRVTIAESLATDESSFTARGVVFYRGAKTSGDLL